MDITVKRIILQLKKKQKNIETNILQKEFNFTSLSELKIKQLQLYYNLLQINCQPPKKPEFAANIELYNEQDQLDYLLFDKLPVSLIKEDLIVKKQTPENSMIIQNNILKIVSPDVEDLVIPNTVTHIAFGAIRGCQFLKTVIFEEGSKVKEIESCTFNRCTSLSNIVLPNSITKISFAAFGGCSSLTNITIPDSVTTIEEQAFA